MLTFGCSHVVLERVSVACPLLIVLALILFLLIIVVTALVVYFVNHCLLSVHHCRCLPRSLGLTLIASLLIISKR